MRLSFHVDPHDDTRANWIVYHARGQNIREEVVLEKYPSSETTSIQLFYCFHDGILGRTGRDFQVLPVIEHGFWNKEGMRHTVVLVYNKSTRHLEKICFVQQERQVDHSEGFDVAASDPIHAQILPKEPTVTLKQLQSRYKTMKLTKAETILANGERQVAPKASTSNVLDRLLQTQGESGKEGNEMIRLVLPNNVVLAYPWRFKRKGAFHILMALPVGHGLQVVDFLFQDARIRNVTASYWDEEGIQTSNV